jgi:hypothetical protein
MTDYVPSLPGENCALGSAHEPEEPYHTYQGYDYGCGHGSNSYYDHQKQIQRWGFDCDGHTCLTQQKGMSTHYISKYSKYLKVHIIKTCSRKRKQIFGTTRPIELLLLGIPLLFLPKKCGALSLKMWLPNQYLCDYTEPKLIKNKIKGNTR